MMGKSIAWLVAICMTVAACGCQQTRSTGSVEHVVLFWLKTPGDKAGREQIIEECHKLTEIPGVVKLTVGTAIPSTRPVVDASFDVGLVITFTDEAAMHAYDVHPIHKKAVSEVLRPLAAKVQVYDIKRVPTKR